MGHLSREMPDDSPQRFPDFPAPLYFNGRHINKIPCKIGIKRTHSKLTMSSPSPSNDPPSPRDKRVRLINVYDAVAGASPTPPYPFTP